MRATPSSVKMLLNAKYWDGSVMRASPGSATSSSASAKLPARAPKMRATMNGIGCLGLCGEVFDVACELGDFLLCFSERRLVLLEDMRWGFPREAFIIQQSLDARFA